MQSKADRFHYWVKKLESPCWIWQGALDSQGYGFITFEKVREKAHRAAYEMFIGPIPKGLVIDHLCRVRCCVNPLHMEPVTPGENVRRGKSNRVRTHCRNGHEIALYGVSVQNSKGVINYRCRECGRISAKKYTEKYPERIRKRAREHARKMRSRVNNVFKMKGEK